MMSDRDFNSNELTAENQQLRSLLASLPAKLLREAAVESATPQPLRTADAERLLREAEDCFRCARLPNLKPEIAEGLEVAGRELMTKAVEIESALQRERRRNGAR
jgi:hypothetical protein